MNQGSASPSTPKLSVQATVSPRSPSSGKDGSSGHSRRNSAKSPLDTSDGLPSASATSTSSSSINFLRGSKTLGRSSRGSGKLVPKLTLDDLEHLGFSVEVDSFKTTSGLLTSYIVYVVRWKDAVSGLTGFVERRYSDFYSLYQHLQKVFQPPVYSYPPFPEKRRFVTISHRDDVAGERLAGFREFVKIFEKYKEFWADAKVHRFFDLPPELRSARKGSNLVSPRKERVSAGGRRMAHRRSGSEASGVIDVHKFPMVVHASSSNIDLKSRKTSANTQAAAALNDIQRSGSDMYLSQILLGEEDVGTVSPIQPRIESTPDVKRKFDDKIRFLEEPLSLSQSSLPQVPPKSSDTEEAKGDLSPVFARKDTKLVHVPRKMQLDSRIRELKDFKLQALIGRGGFGSVFLATEVSTGLVVAIKRMAKNALVRTGKVEQIKMELGVLKLARIKQNRWIVQLHYSFQDEHYIYLAMQYCLALDHQILTNEGFLFLWDFEKRHRDAPTTLLVASYDHLNGTLVYEPASDLIVNPNCKGQSLVQFDNGCVSMLVTKEHDMFIQQHGHCGKVQARNMLSSAPFDMLVAPFNGACQESSLSVDQLKAYGKTMAFSDDHLESWVWELSAQQAKLVVCAACNSKGQMVVRSPSLRDEILRLALHAGLSSQMEVAAVGGWTIHLSSQIKSSFVSKDHVRSVGYSGRTWCVRVPHGTVVTRRALQCHDNVVVEASTPVITGNCPGGDLRHLMDNCEMDEKTTRIFAAEICVCVHQLHALGYVHRDLKPDNFLISQRGHLKLADFGLSEHGFLEEKTRRASSYENAPTQQDLVFSSIMVYFPPSASSGSTDTSSSSLTTPPQSTDKLVVQDEHVEDEMDTLKDDKGRLYKCVKIFVTSATTCSDVIDTLKDKLDIRKQVPYQLLELSYVDNHVHERVVRLDELVEGLYAKFDQDSYRHKFVFRRMRQKGPILARSRAASTFQDTRVVLPLSESRMKLFQVVGSPNYMAREILLGQGYESEVDWWSVGCIIFEMLYSASPFEAPTPEGVFSKILAFKYVVEFPGEPEVSDTAKDLISRFLSPPEHRLGAHGGLEEVRKHEWFNDVNWNELQYSEPPFLPELDSQLDLGYFPQATREGLEKYYESNTSLSESSSGSKSGTLGASAEDTPEAKDLWKSWDWSWFS